MRLRYFVVKREPTTYCGLNLVDTPDVDISVAPVPQATPSRFASAIQVIVCCGQLPTQTPIFGLLVLLGMKMPVGDAISLPFFAAITLIDTVVVAFMIFVFYAPGESVRNPFGGILKKNSASPDAHSGRAGRSGMLMASASRPRASQRQGQPV